MREFRTLLKIFSIILLNEKQIIPLSVDDREILLVTMADRLLGR